MAKAVRSKLTNKHKSKKYSKLGISKAKRRKNRDASRSKVKKSELELQKDLITGPVREDDEVELSDEDLENINELSFLSQTAFEETKKKKKKDANDHKEESYEKQPRKSREDENKNVHVLLPIKSKDGVIPRTIQQETDEGVQEEADEGNGVATEDGDTEASTVQEPPPVLSTAEIFANRHKKIAEKKIQIAQLCGAVLENPETNVSKLRDLNTLCNEKDTDIQITIKKLAMISSCEVYKDIIPGYRIRELSEEEQNMKVSKDIKNLREFEKSLLANYQRYLTILEKTVQEWLTLHKKHRKAEQKLETLSDTQESLEAALQSLSVVSMQCMCDLLVSVPQFNFRTNLINVIVQRMTQDPSDNRQISKMCFETVKKIFKTDLSAEVSLEIVQVLTKMVKSKSYKVLPCTLDCLLSLKIQETDLTAEDDKEPEERRHYKGKNKEDKLRKMKMSKKDKKRQKELKKLEHELKETEAVESKKRVRRRHTEIIKLIFATYFRILKNASHSPLLSTVLEGLAKFAHLINVDFFMDLMKVLQSIMSSQELNHRQNLNCVLTAFKILSGQGEALNIDPRGFYCCLYKTLLHIHAGHTSGDMPAVLQCMDVMLHKRKRQISIARVMGFIKRLCTTSLQLLPHSSVASLACIKSFLQFNQRTESLLDNECLGSGVFLPESEDPESCNADNTTLWELATLSHHFHPTVRTYASHVASGAPPSGAGVLNGEISRMKPLELHERFSFDEANFNPNITPPSKVKKQLKRRRRTTLTDEEYLHPTISEKVRRTSELVDILETIEFPAKPRTRRKTTSKNT